MLHKRVVFTHIGKAGGSSVNGALYAVMVECGASTLAFSGAASVYGDAELPERLLRQHDLDIDDFSLVIGHIPFATARRCFAPARFVTVLRHPAWRLISDYCSQPGNRALPDFGLSRFDRRIRYRWRFDPRFRRRAEWAIDNLHTRMLCDTPGFGRPATKAMLASAQTTLETQYALVGFQDRLDDFLRGLGALYGLNLQPHGTPHLNKTGDYCRMASDRDLEIATQHNSLDMELYEWARTKFAVAAPVPQIAAPSPGKPYRKLEIGPDRFAVHVSSGYDGHGRSSLEPVTAHGRP